MKKEKKEKNFLHLPTYPGGNKAFRKFIEENLKYPEEALKNKIQGDVLISFEVNDYGYVVSSKIIKSLGYGCDEEALRLVKLLKYEKVNNRGIRLTSTVKTTIHFKIKPQKVEISYQLTPEIKEQTSTPVKTEINTYNYVITIPGKS